MGKSQVEIPDKLYFKIGEVSDLTGIKPYVLRYWETEFPLAPKKSRTGQRLYRREDIERVLEISHLLYQRGFTIAGARKHMASGGSSESEAEAVPVDDVEEVIEEAPAAVDTGFLLGIRSQVQALKSDLAALRASR